MSNATFYPFADEVRYLKHNGQYIELASVDSFPELICLLNACKSQTSLSALSETMCAQFGMSEKRTRHLAKQLIDLQLLFSERQANITGQDYFNRLGIPVKSGPDNYIIAQRSRLHAPLKPEQMRAFDELLEWLRHNFETKDPADLLAFKTAFRYKYEGNMVSLAQALDPESGIGYGDAPLSAASTMHTELKNYLLRHIINGEDIYLENFVASQAKESAQFPNTFSALVRFYGEQMVIDALGGITANSLIGRFSLADNEIEAMGKDIALYEEQANPDIVFFDVAYQAEGHVDNVNRRAHFYRYELPLLSYSTLKDPITADDLYITMKRQELILYSRKLRKRVMPRIPSAYNYRRSDLPLFRFLCDIQRQGLFTGMSFHLAEEFPGFDYYPTIRFKNFILASSIWKLPAELLQEKDRGIQAKKVEQWLNATVADRLFRSGHGDQTLCFDPKMNMDRQAFINYIRSFKGMSCYLQEALVKPEEGIKDAQGRTYMAQYLFNFGHQKPLYKPLNHTFDTYPAKTDAFKLPGEEWLYFEIYAHPNRSNTILKSLITNSKTLKNKIRKWFFIRYSHPAPHIRFRIKLKNANDSGVVLQNIQQGIKPFLVKGYVQDFCLKTYFREIMRYQVAPIDLIERFFAADSRYVFNLIPKFCDDEHRYAEAIYFMEHLFPVFSIEPKEQQFFTEQIAAAFAREMQTDYRLFKQINTYYKPINLLLEKLRSRPEPAIFPLIQQLFIKIMNYCTQREARHTMFADLIHMHVNRLFVAEQRYHEMVIYQLMRNHLRAKQAQLRLLKEHVSL